MRNVHKQTQPLPRIYSFPFVAREDARVLILGTAPSAASLAAGFNYAHPRNAFWPIMFALFGGGAPSAAADWESRRALLLSNRVALWDVARACAREGSADSSIRDAEANDIPGLLNACPGIGMIFLNGQKAAALFRKLAEPALTERQSMIPRATLPSTSPARAEPLAAKLEKWQAIRAFLDTQMET
ncbi:MAG: DNA-deoxyinosine glycosylase [Oscillospiraceae bacterium]|nr:DNA-deoxyinosine glycosylase [Oscillospiraceae bacterium]